MPIALLIAVALFFCAMPVIFSIVVRDSVKRSRQEMIRSVDDFLNPREYIFGHFVDMDRAGEIVRSLEFLKFKYDLNEDDKSMIFMPHEWLISSMLLAFLLGLLLLVGEVTIASLMGVTVDAVPCVIQTHFACHTSQGLVLLASILGAYTYMLRAFHQAVQNFDLSPASFHGAASNIVFAVAVTQIATFHLAESAQGSSIGTGLLMVTAFLGAYMPDDILRYFLSISAIRQLKEERSDFGKEIQTIPIEVLDGVDSRVRSRLSDFHIESVQHLASANPLMLFVETPYGFYQTLDWVAQAQLFASVGPDAAFRLWRLGVRTIFDLERAALWDEFVDVEVLQAIERIILPELVTRSDDWDAGAIVANVRIRVDGSDTRRLRQIVNRVNERLGAGAALLS